MFSSWIPVFAMLVLIAGTGRAQAQSIGQCQNRLTNRAIAAGGLRCDIVEDFLKCLIRIDVSTIGAENIPVSQIQNDLDKQLSNAGLSCNLNVQKAIDEVLQEGTTQSPVNTPQRFDDAKDTGGCLDALTYQVSQRADSVCNLAQEHVKCVFRVNDLHNLNPTRQEIQRLENIAETSLRNEGVFCNLDGHKALRELRNNSPQTPSTVSQRPPTVSQRPSTVSQRPSTVSQRPSTVSQRPSTVSQRLLTVSQRPSTVSQRPSSSQKPEIGLDTATTHDECINATRRELSLGVKPVCDVFQEAFKCGVRVRNLHNQASLEQIEDIAKQSEEFLMKTGLHCDLDASKAVSERNGKENHSPNLFYSLTSLVLSLLVICIV